MATQSLALDNPPQVEASLNPTQDFGTRIRAITYDAPAFKNAEEFRTAFEEAEKGAHESAKTKFKAEGDLVLYVAKIQSYLQRARSECPSQERGRGTRWL
jgi:membrane protein involved in colicin uptake